MRATETIEVHLLSGEKVSIELYTYINYLEKKQLLKKTLYNQKIKGNEILGDIDLGEAQAVLIEVLYAKSNEYDIKDININDLDQFLEEKLVFILGSGGKETEKQ